MLAFDWLNWSPNQNLAKFMIFPNFLVHQGHINLLHLAIGEHMRQYKIIDPSKHACLRPSKKWLV